MLLETQITFWDIVFGFVWDFQNCFATLLHSFNKTKTSFIFVQNVKFLAIKFHIVFFMGYDVTQSSRLV